MPRNPKTRSDKTPLEESYETFDLLRLSRRKDRQKIRELIIGQLPVNPAPYSILDYLLSRIGRRGRACKSVIIENSYVDKNFSNAFSVFYSHSFRRTKKECIRLHFFSCDLTETDVLNLEDKSEYYLGFTVLRPIPFRMIGRSILKRLRHDPHTEFPTCHGTTEVNIGGSRLHIDAPVFMEQDTMVASCASVAIWMSTTTIAQRFNTQECTTCEITEKATQYLIKGRPMPSEGLHYEQMLQALRSMDYDPIIYGVDEQAEAKHIIYSYIESEIPPIIICRLADGGDHAIVGIGHGYECPVIQPSRMEVVYEDELPLTFARSSEWVPHLLVNDDQRGIYRKLEFISPDPNIITERVLAVHQNINIDDFQHGLGEWHCPIAIDENMPAAEYSGGEQIANIWAIIVPLPKGVILQSEQAELKSARLLRYWHIANNWTFPNDLVLRTYLIPSNEYKQRIAESDMDSFVHILYRGKPMPRWIWVTEISSENSYNSSSPSKWLIRGEIILDATSSPWTADFIAFHLIGDEETVLATMKPEHKDEFEALSVFWYTKSTEWYHGWIR